MSLGLDDEFLVDNVHAPSASGNFEGVEKKLVIDFKGKGSLRDVKRSAMDSLFMNACCSAISKTSNAEMDAYVLSESSCFVYPKRIILKTCGTTEPIGAVPAILSVAGKLDLTIHSLLYCHMDFLFPKAQSPIYRRFTTERELLSAYFTKAAKAVSVNLLVDGNPAWNVYAHGEPTHTALEILMYDLNRDVMDQYFKKPGQDGSVLTEASGVTSLADPEAKWDSFLFSPCGYSANGLLDGTYWTIHVTPEEECSYVSFELSPCPDNIETRVEEVLDFYKPGRFSIVVSSNMEREGPGSLDGAVSCGVVRQEVVPGYHVWVGHFMTPEHMKKAVTPSDKATDMVDQQSRKYDSGIPSLTGKLHDYGLFGASPNEDGRSATDVHKPVFHQKNGDNDWEAYSSTEEAEDAPRYEKRSKTSLDESDHKEARASQVGVRLARATKVVG